MKPMVKMASLFMAMLMLFSAIASGCSVNKEWAYKANGEELPIGVYITALYEAYSEAKTYAEKLDGYDASKSDWLDKEITDDDGNKAVASKWIKEHAELRCLELMAAEAEMKKLGATVDSAMMSSLNEAAESNWYFGTTYTQYIGYFTPLKDTLAPKGVSLESFKRIEATFAANSQVLFDKLYLAGGTQEVKKDEITKYFEKNYVKYSYLPVPLYDSTTDEAQQQKKVALSDAKVKEITTALDGYAKKVNAESDAAKAAASSEKLIGEYIKANSMEESALVSNVGVRNETNVGDEVDKVIAELGEGKAKTVKVGTGENATYYYVFRYSTKAAKEEYLADGSNDTSIITKMKKKDFNKYLEGLADNLKHEKGSAVDGYDPKMFYVKPEETTAAATEG